MVNTGILLWLLMQEQNGWYTSRRCNKGSQDLQNKVCTVPHCRSGKEIIMSQLLSTWHMHHCAPVAMFSFISHHFTFIHVVVSVSLGLLYWCIKLYHNDLHISHSSLLHHHYFGEVMTPSSHFLAQSMAGFNVVFALGKIITIIIILKTVCY